VIDGEADGFAALYTNNGVIVGATFVAAHAGESLPLLTLAVARRMTPADLAAVIHCYPTQAEAIQRVADHAITE
jgi:pyruvate/2-oxoglutarate dehydrogenase complex dihydrolipoamide dehydrogenase (E3) component